MTPDPNAALRPDTQAVHAGRDDLTALGVHAPPLDLSSTYPLASFEAGGESLDALLTGGSPGPGGNVYSRAWNPTVARFERALAALEHADGAVAFASGMAAITASLMAAMMRGPGRHVVAVRPLYGGTDALLDSGALGTTVSWCEAKAVGDAVRADTCLVVIESPGNPTLELIDIEAVVHAAGRVPVLVDNTFATPVLQNPLDLGASLVVHSATKYLGGHGDVLAGVVAGSAEWVEAIRPVRALTGGVLHPLAGYLLHRGLPTLPVRVRAAQENARAVAQWLSGHELVARVHYPGLPGGDPEGLLPRQMRGPGAMVAFRPAAGVAAVPTIAESVRLFTHAVSLGGVDSLLEAPAAFTHRMVDAAEQPDADVVRLSIGLEDPQDLIDDLDQALRAGP